MGIGLRPGGAMRIGEVDYENALLFLPGLKGQAGAITLVEDKGEKVAKSIEVKTGKP